MESKVSSEVKRYGHPVLRKKADEVTVFDDAFRESVERMKLIMIESDGIGLAAPQVGISQRFFIMGIPHDMKDKEGPRDWYVVVNPIFTYKSQTEIIMEEGCLSFPGLYFDVARPEELTVSYRDEFGELHEMTTDGYLARVIQHENDHLDGVLFIDRISALKRSMMRKRLKQLQE